MSLHQAKEDAISFLEARHKTKADRRARLRDQMRSSSHESERHAVQLAEFGHTVDAICRETGVERTVASILVMGEP